MASQSGERPEISPRYDICMPPLLDLARGRELGKYLRLVSTMKMEKREVCRGGGEVRGGAVGHSRALAYMQCDDTAHGSDAL